jgi:hypothetical protein
MKNTELRPPEEVTGALVGRMNHIEDVFANTEEDLRGLPHSQVRDLKHDLSNIKTAYLFLTEAKENGSQVSLSDIAPIEENLNKLAATIKGIKSLYS